MIVAVIVMSCVTFVSVVTTGIAIYSAYKANKANSVIAETFTNVFLNNSDRVDYFENGEHSASSFTFPNSEGF